MRRAARDDFDAQIRDLEERIRRQRSANGRLSGPTRDQGHRPGKDDEAANRRKKDPTAASYPGATRWTLRPKCAGWRTSTPRRIVDAEGGDAERD